MNKIVLIIAILLVVGVGVFFVSNNKGALNQVNQTVSETYYNANREIKFQYPSTWKVDTQIVDGPNPIIGRFDRDKDVSLILLHSINKDNLTFDAYAKSSLEELKFAPGYSLVTEETKDVNGVKTYQVTANYENNVKSRSVYFVSPDNTRLFGMVYRSTQDKFDQYLSEFEGILNTVEVK